MNKLMTNKMKKVKNKKGFTLIELVVVIAILGILAAIAVPRLTGFRTSANQSAAEAEARTAVAEIALGIADGSITDDAGMNTAFGNGDVTGATFPTLTFTFTHDNGVAVSVVDGTVQ